MCKHNLEKGVQQNVYENISLYLPFKLTNCEEIFVLI